MCGKLIRVFLILFNQLKSALLIFFTLISPDILIVSIKKNIFILIFSIKRMKIKKIEGKIILDSRKEKTIEVSVKSEAGVFIASAPEGKSKGKHEKPTFIFSVEDDIKTLSSLNLDINVNSFSELKKIEEIARDRIGANTLFALETAVLKALAFEQKKQLWQVINPEARKMPFPVGNVLGGGMHTAFVNGKKPDFQEFLVIPKAKKFSDCVFLMQKIHKNIGEILKERKVAGKLNDENAWATSLSNGEVLELLNEERKNIENESGEKIEIGIDIASSSFYDGLYMYKNEEKNLSKDEQIEYVSELVNKFDIFYIEDPLNEEDFSGFKIFREKNLGKCLIAGDDLTVTRPERFLKALKTGSVNAIIIKPNQNGSLIETRKIVEVAKKYEIATIMSHRSGETMDYSIADLAFGFQTDFVKFGVAGKEREIKLKRMIEIERQVFG